MDFNSEMILGDEPTNLIGNQQDYHLKCGEILVSNGRTFLLTCCICNSNFQTLRRFTEHVFKSHSFTDFEHIYNNSDGNDALDNCNDDGINENPAEDFCITEINDKIQFSTVEGNFTVSEVKQFAANPDTDDSDQSEVETKLFECENEKINEFVSFDLITNNQEKFKNNLRNTRKNTNYIKTLNLIKSANLSTSNPAHNALSKLKKYPCKWCDKVYPYSSSLSKHTRKEHKNSDCLTCTKCKLQFTKQKLLLTHIRRKHTNHKLFACSLCSAIFSFKRELTDHEQRVHDKSEKFRCNFCVVGFGFKKDLMHHEQTVHIDQRPFQCQICSFAFKEKKHLIRHERTHTGEKPYQCDFCDEKFTRMDKKKAHHKKKHESQLY